VSGLILVAKTTLALPALCRGFAHREIKKKYRAVVVGRLEGAGDIRTPVDGLESHSEYRVIRTCRDRHYGWLTLVELSPVTGRTHQLRVHTASLGHPIVGDDLYHPMGLQARRRLRTERGETAEGGWGAPTADDSKANACRMKWGLLLQSVEIAFAHPRSDSEEEAVRPSCPSLLLELIDDATKFLTSSDRKAADDSFLQDEAGWICCSVPESRRFQRCLDKAEKGARFADKAT
jgi:23S rRNA-/tRNA-specific pseudouridylate synthase